MSELHIQDLSAGYGGVDVLHGVTLDVMPGEIVSLIGANGAGKSTLVAALLGLITPSSGRIVQEGQEITGVPSHRRTLNGIASVLEGRHLFAELTVQASLDLAWHYGQLRLSKRPGATLRYDIEGVFDLLPALSDKRHARVGVLSGGQQQMVTVARALLLQPDILVLDEPSSGLAPKLVEDIMVVIDGLKATGLSVLLVEQNVGVARAISERVYVLELGRVVAEGTWDDVADTGSIAAAYLGGGGNHP